ncbi:fructose-1,6-bisphosphatase/inositol monophosphatase family enzyme [Sphingomonas insulae]|uniref:Inositol monophosphatase family protein n=1 Tax=Sphingomonas insulae TaxID=424800 RepID=A0ABP3T2E9_9SPHN|nr:inositol monophosphatase family protein [Sphingomonas insulae]NIJ28968.1 fructose-1,6-bisphosphatase/inositol monophosphatase family enzyme [Sphingomonas insulae]
MYHRHHDAVVALMRDVAAQIVMPRFRNLAADEVEEKAADDMVTIADRESEAALTAGLAALDPAIRVIGEEAVAADAALVDGIDRGAAWIIDPIDGTNNYASGIATFGIMIALVNDGETQAGWILDPVRDRLCHATLGGGAWIDSERVFTRPSGAERPSAALATYFMTDEEKAALYRRAETAFTLSPMPRCAAEQYPRLVLGTNDIALFQKTLPWDHAPGSLFLREAGGVVRWPDGKDYRVGDQRRGMIAAASPDLWERAAKVLVPTIA